MISGELEFTLKIEFILSKLKLWEIVVISKFNTKMHNFNEILYKYFVNTILNSKKYFCPLLPWTLKQKECENVIFN